MWRLGGGVGLIECLVSPAPPCPVSTGSPFLDRRFLNPVWDGYRFELRLGPPGSTAFVYAATPVMSKPGSTRTLCIDASDEIRYAVDGRLRSDPGDRCLPALPVLR